MRGEEAVERLVSRISRGSSDSFRKASASPSASPEISAPPASARYSRRREIASWIPIAATGARSRPTNAIASRIAFPRVPPRRPPPQNSIRRVRSEIMAMTPTRTATSVINRTDEPNLRRRRQPGRDRHVLDDPVQLGLLRLGDRLRAGHGGDHPRRQEPGEERPGEAADSDGDGRGPAVGRVERGGHADGQEGEEDEQLPGEQPVAPDLLTQRHLIPIPAAPPARARRR